MLQPRTPTIKWAKIEHFAASTTEEHYHLNMNYNQNGQKRLCQLIHLTSVQQVTNHDWIYPSFRWVMRLLTATSMAQSPPIICKSPPRIAKGDEQVIRHADRQPPWTASPPVAKKQSYLINCTLSITHEVVYPKKNTHLIIHTNLVHFQKV